MKRRLPAIIFSSLFFLFGQKSIVWAQLGCGGGLGPFADFFCNKSNQTAEAAGTRLNSALGALIGFLTILGGLWFFIQFIIAGYNWISAGGDKGKVEQAQQKITNSLVGLLIVIGAYVIVGLVGSILGLKILNPGEILQDLSL